MLRRRSDAAWKRFGELDPYFGVFSHDKFRRENLDESAIGEFFRSGEEHVEWLLQTIRGRIDSAFGPRRTLDFGCGVGRFLIPFARISHRVVGVDVSGAMLREAQKNCEARGIVNVELAPSDDRLAHVHGTFDFIHSWIVLQHIPPRRGMAIVQALLTRLDVGGVGALHFTYGSLASRGDRAKAWLRTRVPGLNAVVNFAKRRPPSYPVMQMNRYDTNRVFKIVQAAACDGVFAHFTNHDGNLGVVLLFRKLPAPPAGYKP